MKELAGRKPCQRVGRVRVSQKRGTINIVSVGFNSTLRAGAIHWLLPGSHTAANKLPKSLTVNMAQILLQQREPSHKARGGEGGKGEPRGEESCSTTSQ